MFFLQLTEAAVMHTQGCHLAFLNAKSAKSWFFKNCFPELKWFGHFWPFLNCDKNSIFSGMFWINLSNFQTFYKILNFNLVILKKFWRKFGLYVVFFHFSGFGLFETAYGQIWPYKFFWTWQPCAHLFCVAVCNLCAYARIAIICICLHITFEYLKCQKE